MKHLVHLFKEKPLEMIARLGVFGTFLGHGIVAYGVNPKWIKLITCVGFTEIQAVAIMPFIGIMDIVVACMALFYPVRGVLIWAAFWAFLAAMSRPMSGGPMVEFVERASNFCLPMVLLVVMKRELKEE